jgi:hypothetical protein
LYIILKLVTNELDLLNKRLNESEKLKGYNKSNSARSLSTSNTLLDEIDDINIKNVSEFKVNEQTEIDWKREIERSIERISEKIASNNSNVLVAVLEKRLNEMYNDNAKLKKAFENFLENSSVVKKNSDKYDKSEKVVQELISQISAMKNSNLQYQTDFLKNLNEINEKLISQELMWEQLETFEIQTNRSLELVNNDFAKINNSLKFLTEKNFNLCDRISTVEEKNIPELSKLSSKFKDDIVRIDGTII